MKILIADSDEAARKQLAQTIASSDDELFEASTTAEALATIREEGIHLILSGQQLADTPTLDFCRTIRKVVYNKHYTYIVLTLADDNPAGRTEAFKAGADAVLPFPFEAMDVQALITAGRRIVSFQPLDLNPGETPSDPKNDPEIGKPEISKYDRVLAKIALTNKLLTKKQLAEAFSIQSLGKRKDRDTPLAEILLAKKMILPEMLNALHSATKRRMGRRFGVLAVRKNFATQEQVDNALKIQSEEYRKTKDCRRIGDILVAEGAINGEQRDLIWREQEQIEKLPDSARHQTTASGDEQDASPGQAPQVTIDIAEDRITATLILGPGNPNDVSLAQVKALLAEQAIQYGILDDDAIHDFLQRQRTKESSLVVAKGKPPVPGQNASITYHFQTEFLGAGKITEDGVIDYRERGERPHVEAGALLAEKIPPKEGVPGISVTGEEIPVADVEDIKLKCEGGTELSGDGLQAYAKIEGEPNLSKTGVISVFSELNIKGDVDFQTGNVDFEGNVNVSGSIHDGFQVKGGNVFAKEIMAAKIVCKGDVVVPGGIIGAVIEAEGSVVAKYIENANIKAFGDVTVGKEVRDSKIRASGRFASETGKIISSYVSAKLGITTKEIGTDVSEPCKISFGVDDNLRKILQSYDYKKEEVRKILEEKQKEYEASLLSQQKMQEQIAVSAQAQDFAINEQRKLNALFEQLKEKNQPEATAKAEAAATAAGEKAKSAEKQLAKLFDMEEELDKKASQQLKEVENLIQKIESIQQEKVSVSQQDEKDQKKPLVKVTGNLFSGTKVQSRHASLSIKETIRNVTLKETKIPDTENDWEITTARG